MPYTGTADMLDDGSISLHLRLTSDGKPINDTAHLQGQRPRL